MSTKCPENFVCQENVQKMSGRDHVLEHFPDAQIPDIFLTLQNLSRICPESSVRKMFQNMTVSECFPDARKISGHFPYFSGQIPNFLFL